MAQQPQVGHGLSIIEGSRSRSDKPYTVGLLWTSDQPGAQTSTWQHKILGSDIHAIGSIGTQTPAIERPQTARPLRSVLYQCSCHYLLPMCQTSFPDSKLLQNIKVHFVFVCFQYGVLLGQHFYIPFNRMPYIIMTWHIILVKMFVFSSIWRAILANKFVLRSEAALYSSENICVSINKKRYFCQHLLFHPNGMCYFSKKLLFHYDIVYYFREHLFCSTWHDLSLWRKIDVSSWYGIIFQRIFVVFLSACLFISGNFLSCSYNKSQGDARFLNFILVENSTLQQLVFVILVMLTVCQTVNVTSMTNTICCKS